MKLTNLIINPMSIGKKPLLVDVQPSYKYEDGKRTTTIAGYKYIVALPDHGFEKISVKIDGEQRIELQDKYTEVGFEKLELFIYWLNGNYEVGARATNIYAMKEKQGA